jgi:hypothetical protein
MNAADVLESIAGGVGIVGVVVILWGVVIAAVATLRVEVANLRHQQLPRARVRLRQQLGSSLLWVWIPHRGRRHTNRGPANT